MTEDPQQIWTDYYARIRQRRIAQAKALHEQMSADGVTDETLLTIDFLHFGNDEADVEDLAEQLSENYTMTVIERPEKDYWNAEGTIYPCAVDGISPERGIAWVEFMCDVAESYACVFSTWKFTDAERQISWTSEAFDIEE